MSSLFQRVLGQQFPNLPALMQEIHNGKPQRWIGLVTVSWGTNPWVKRMLSIARIPAAGRDLPCQIDFVPTLTGERFLRSFSGQPLNSYLQDEGVVMNESFGPLKMSIATVVKQQQIFQHCQNTKFLGIPLPKPLQMRIKAREWCKDSKLFFDICIGLECGFYFLRYRGHLVPVTTGGE